MSWHKNKFFLWEDKTVSILTNQVQFVDPMEKELRNLPVEAIYLHHLTQRHNNIILLIHSWYGTINNAWKALYCSHASYLLQLNSPVIKYIFSMCGAGVATISTFRCGYYLTLSIWFWFSECLNLGNSHRFSVFFLG